MQIDISKIPFSKYGSLISITRDDDSGNLTIRNIRQKWGLEKIFTLSFLKDSKEIKYELDVTPSAVNVLSREGTARVYLKGDQGLVVDSRGLDVRIQLTENQHGFGYKEEERKYKFMALIGQACAIVNVLKGSIIEEFERVIENHLHINKKNILNISTEQEKVLINVEISAFEGKHASLAIETDAEISNIEDEWRGFLAKMTPVPEAYKPYAELLWYNIWSCFVRAEGNFKYDAVLMSKGCMAAVWSWDHCFNALALVKADLNAALEQFFLLFELQSDTGYIPDCIAANTISNMVSKPPIHGWCFNRIMQGHELDAEILEKAYKHMEAWTNWYFEYRDTDGDGIPNYNFGCDSGWDNSSMFDKPGCLETPDLSAFLFLQMKTLEKIANKLRKTDDAGKWCKRADELLSKLFDHSWSDKGFKAKQSGSHYFEEDHTSMLIIMPIILGEFLPLDKLEVLIEHLRKDFLTSNGVATESLRSPKYNSNGYWRGPIWAPTTYLLADGLRRAGKNDLALEIARGFSEMVRNSGGRSIAEF